MTDTHPGIAILATLVRLIQRKGASADLRRDAVLLAMHLFQLEEISKSKCLEVARAAGSTAPALDDAIRALQDDSSGDVPPDWAQLGVPLPLTDEAITQIGARASELERVLDAADRLIDADDETFRKLAK